MKYKVILPLSATILVWGCHEPSAKQSYTDALSRIEGCYVRDDFQPIKIIGGEILYGGRRVFQIERYAKIGKSENRLIYVKPRLYLQLSEDGRYEFKEYLGFNSEGSALFGEIAEAAEGRLVDVVYGDRKIRFYRTGSNSCDSV